MKVRVLVSLKEGVLDPQGKAVGHALEALNFEGVKDVRISRVVDIELDTDNIDEAKQQAEAMAHGLLANEVIEDFSVEVLS